jgi:hypothetical protein
MAASWAAELAHWMQSKARQINPVPAFIIAIADRP